MTTLAIDIDDTLYDFGDLARRMAVDLAIETEDKRLRRLAYCAWSEWRTPSDVTDIDRWSAVIARCHAPEQVICQIPYPYAAEILREVVEEGHHLHYISNRHPDSWDITHDWLEFFGFPVAASKTQLTCTMKDKMPLINECQYIIDDRPKTLVQFVYDFRWKYKHGSENLRDQRHGFGLHKPYNAALTDVPRIKLAPNWVLLRQYLIDQKVLSGTIS